MRKDKGLNGDLDRLPLLTWLMFLKFLDDHERPREDEAVLAGKKYRPAIDPPYRWRDWAASRQASPATNCCGSCPPRKPSAPTPQRGRGLIPYLRAFAGSADPKRRVVGEVFAGRDQPDGVGLPAPRPSSRRSTASTSAARTRSTPSAHLYESHAEGDAGRGRRLGEFYTPRAVVRFMVAVTDPRLGETVLDPAARHRRVPGRSVRPPGGSRPRRSQDRGTLQRRSIFGSEAKPLPYMLCQMNLLLHGLDAPQIDEGQQPAT